MRNAFVRTLEERMAEDARIVLLTADLGFKIFDNIPRKFPGRFVNVGVSEQAMISVAAGMALSGLRPVCYSIAPFATARCLEQIRDDVCAMKLPVTIVGVGGGVAYALAGFTHWGTDDYGLMRLMPGMEIYVPADPKEAAGAIGDALAGDAPAYIRLSRAGEPDLPRFKLERGVWILRDGTHGWVVAVGPIAGRVLAAAERLAEKGLPVGVVSAYKIRPSLNIQLFLQDHRGCPALVVEEHQWEGSLTQSLHGLHQIDGCAVPGLTLPDPRMLRPGDRDHLLAQAGMSVEAMADWMEATGCFRRFAPI